MTNHSWLLMMLLALPLAGQQIFELTLDEIVVNSIEGTNVRGRNSYTDSYGSLTWQFSGGLLRWVHTHDGKSGNGSFTAQGPPTVRATTSTSVLMVFSPAADFLAAQNFPSGLSIDTTLHVDPLTLGYLCQGRDAIDLKCAVNRMNVETAGGVSRPYLDSVIRIYDTPPSRHYYELLVKTYFRSIPAATPDVAVTGMFAVQVVQRLDGPPIPMIPGKMTLVRVFVKSLGDNAKILTGVIGALTAEEFPGVRVAPMNVARAVTGTPDPNSADDSLNFLLPKEWTRRSRLTLTAAVVLGELTETNLENNKNQVPFVLEFLPANGTGPVYINYWEVCVAVNLDLVPPNVLRDKLDLLKGGVICPTETIDQAAGLLRAVLPVDEDRLIYLPMFPPLLWPNALETPEAANVFFKFINTMRLLFKKRIDSPFKYYSLSPWSAMLPRDRTGSVPVGQYGTLSVLTFDECQTDLTIEHFGGETCGERSSRLLATKIARSLGGGRFFLEAGQTGFNSSTLTIVKAPAGGLTDSPPLGWVSATDYERVAIELRISPDNIATGEKGVKAANETSETLLVSGNIGAAGSTASLDPAFRFSQSIPDQGNPNGAWCVRLRRPSGADVDSCFDPEPGPDNLDQGFVVETPWFPDVTRVSLIRRVAPSVELASLVVGDAPALSFSAPQRGDVWEGKRTIAWSGSGPGGNPLTYILLYSNDGGATWLPLSANLQATRFDIDTGHLAGGTRVYFRVMASNGLTSSSADVGPIEIRQNPRLGVTSQRVDFKNSTLGEVAQASVAVRNTGSGPLTVTAALPEVSPFSFAVKPAQVVIPSGRQTQIRLQYRPSSTGQHQAELRLTGAGSTEVVVVRGAAFDKPVPSIVAPASFDFGRIPVNTTKDTPLTLRNDGRAALTIQSIVSSSTAYQPLVTSLEVAPGGQANLMVRVRPAASGPVSGRLTIRSNDPTSPSIDIAVSATGAQSAPPAAMTVAPASLDFGSVTVGQTRTLSVAVSNPGSTVLQVTAASNSVRFPATPSAFTVNPGAQQAVTVVFRPDAPGPQSGTLTITGNDPAQPILNVALSGTGTASTATPTPAPSISVTPASLDFGSVNTGQTKDLTFTVSNRGTAALSISSIGAPAAPFSLVNEPSSQSVAVGAQITLTARFAPSAAGTFRGTVSIAGNDPANATVSVALTGASVATTPIAGGNGPVLYSDSFNRPNADRCALGAADNALGGSGSHYYIPLYSRAPGGASPIGAAINSGSLFNTGIDFTGVQVAAKDGACLDTTVVGESFAPDLNIRADVFLPSTAGYISQAGPFFGAQAVNRGGDLNAGTPSGFWVQVHSTGEVKIVSLQTMQPFAVTGRQASFDSAIFHTVEAAVSKGTLQVALDGKLLTFRQEGRSVTVVQLIQGFTANGAAVGILMGAGDNPGQVGGQRAKNLTIAGYGSLSALPPAQ